MKPHKETDKFITYRIAHIFKYNPTLKQRGTGGRVILARQWKESPTKIAFTALSYSLPDKNAVSNTQANKRKNKYCLSYKNGQLNLYSINTGEEGKKRIRNCSVDTNLITSLYLNKDEHAKNLARIINQFLKNNGIKKRLVIKNITISTFNQQFRLLLYPGAKGVIKEINSNWSRLFRYQLPIKQIIKKIYGYNGKKITKLFCGKCKQGMQPHTLDAGLVWKGLVPLDYLYRIFDMQRVEWHSRSQKYQDTRNFLKKLTERQRIALLLDCCRENFRDFYVRDVVRMDKQRVEPVEYPTNLTTWQQYHHILSPPIDYGRRYTQEIQKEIIFEYSDKFLKLDNVEIDDMRIELPKTSFKLNEYSDKMNNCVRSYATSVENKYCIILGIYKENKLTYNVELRRRELGQFLGKRNREPDAEDKNKVVRYLQDNDFIKATVVDFAVRTTELLQPF